MTQRAESGPSLSTPEQTAPGRSGVGASTPLPIEIRPLKTAAELEACVALQRETWGAEFEDCVPASILKVSQRLGGVVAGAFQPDGRLVGFVFGMTGVESGRLVHWSDMLAVRSEVRDQGIGRRLKAFQRDAVRELGVAVIYWTFDPLVARNAHLNINALGARITEYVVDMYGSATSSVLHAGIGTDRFVVAWPTDDSPPTRPPVATEERRQAPLLNGDPSVGVGAPLVRIAIPLSIATIQSASPADAARWRAETRQAFLWSLEHGYEVVEFETVAARESGIYTLALSSTSSPEQS